MIAGPTFFSSPAASGDVVLLLHMDGSSGGTTFTDSSTTPKTVSRVGTGVTTTGSSTATGFNFSSALTVANHAGLALGSSEFTIETWCSPTTLAANFNLLFHGNIATPNSQKQFDIYSAGSGVWQIYFYTSGGTSVSFNTASVPFAASASHHLAIVRSGNTIKAYVGGALAGSTSFTFTVGTPIDSLYVGNYSGLAQPFPGDIDEVRITKGVALYTAPFTPPSAPFPNP